MLPNLEPLSTPPFHLMNETDVREVIVRPLLARLGYQAGTAANIRTEVTLRYAKAFLGRKKPGKDPDLVGRADYVCEAVSYGRWVVEAKSPQEEFSQDDVEQAHTYCAHPEIGATHFLLTNGREFRLYAVGALDAPLMQWQYQETEEKLLSLFNLLGYEAVKRRAITSRPDVGKPLGLGLPSRVAIVGGHLTYGEHKSDHPLFNSDYVNGMNATFTGHEVFRTNDGLITARVEILSAFSSFAKLNKLAGIDGYEFSTSEEYVSTDVEKPSVFQNVIQATIPRGIPVKIPPLPEIPMPLGVEMKAFTQAVGYVENDKFTGVFEIDYDYVILSDGRTGVPQIDAMLRSVPRTATMLGAGEFDIRIKI